jgi:hypothetical protein
LTHIVMRGLGPSDAYASLHEFSAQLKTWVPGTSPGTTREKTISAG